jgi:bifunctional non-homologous end joining protein LigD
MSLTEYKNKRHFQKTPEPEGKPASGKGDKLVFVVQKHAASHLHYDFRLELKGALKSWAVPKGPSMNPADKRLAMLVEDHPFDYKDFEGIIPAGNYGAGTVIIWDQGTYEPAEQFATKAEQEKALLKAFYSGSMRIRMNGRKLKGEFALVQSKGREENAWLLMKKTDEASSAEDITLKDKSVVSGRTLEEVAGNKRSRKWISNRSADGKLKEESKEEKVTSKQSKKVGKKEEEEPVDQDYDTVVKEIVSGLKGKGKQKMKTAAFPTDLKPMLATLVDQPFDDPEWRYEVKWDGYRALAYVNKGKADLRSRNNNDFNSKFYPVYRALENWQINAVVDGEIVVVNEDGLSQFGKLQDWKTEADGELLFYVFDILWLEGVELINLPLTERRQILGQIVPAEGIVKLSESFETSGTEFYKLAQQMGLEGIIAKKADSIYRPDTRTKEWLKIKTEQRHEAVIAGYTRNEGSRKTFSAVILGVYDKGKLTFIGQAGTGFTDKLQEKMLKALKPLETSKCPFPEEPVINKPTRFRPNPPKADVVWVKPELVCEVKYQELSKDGIMRHPSFQGLREDKKAKEVVREVSVPVETVMAAVENETEPDLNENNNDKKEKKGAAAPAKKAARKNGAAPLKESGRSTLLNPKDETQTKTIAGRELQFTNLSKIYWPKEQISKRDMLNYYNQVAPYMLPYMKDRPQSLNRHPDGINGESFYQKNVAGKVEPWITTHAYDNTTSEGNKTFLVCTDEASLMYIAKLGCIEMNPWHSRVQSPDNPDWCVIDLDPDNNPFEQVIDAARVVHSILESIDVPSYPKTSGSTGIHIYIPLGAQYSYDQSKQLAELIVTFAHQELGSFTSLERSPARRKGKIYLDYLQNRAIQTIAAPYSLRPKPGATASAPLNWDEVKPGLDMKDFNINTMLERIKSEGDIFKPVLGKGINLEKVLNKISTVFG